MSNRRRITFHRHKYVQCVPAVVIGRFLKLFFQEEDSYASRTDSLICGLSTEHPQGWVNGTHKLAVVRMSVHPKSVSSKNRLQVLANEGENKMFNQSSKQIVVCIFAALLLLTMPAYAVKNFKVEMDLDISRVVYASGRENG